MDGYVAWYEANLAAAAAYQSWHVATRPERAFAFDAYQAALDREEHAASAYQELIEQVGP
jgi:hypothetical protein